MEAFGSYILEFFVRKRLGQRPVRLIVAKTKPCMDRTLFVLIIILRCWNQRRANSFACGGILSYVNCDLQQDFTLCIVEYFLIEEWGVGTRVGCFHVCWLTFCYFLDAFLGPSIWN